MLDKEVMQDQAEESTDAALEAQPGSEHEELDQPEEPETSPGEEQEADSEQDEAAVMDDEISVSIGDESPTPEQKAPDWVRELRKKYKAAQQENRELRQKYQALNPAQEQVQLGPKPTLDSFDYESDKYEAALSDWYEKKRLVDEQQKQQQAAAEQQRQAWANQLQCYEQKKSELKVKDFDEAEALTLDTLSQTQQAVLLKGADNPALLFYTLGKNPAKAKELAGITDPVQFAFKAAKLEKDIKVTSKRRSPPPERRVSSAGGKTSGAMDATLDKLRAEASKTGNYTKVVEYKRRKARQG